MMSTQRTLAFSLYFSSSAQLCLSSSLPRPQLPPSPPTTQVPGISQSEMSLHGAARGEPCSVTARPAFRRQSMNSDFLNLTFEYPYLFQTKSGSVANCSMFCVFLYTLGPCSEVLRRAFWAARYTRRSQLCKQSCIKMFDFLIKEKRECSVTLFLSMPLGFTLSLSLCLCLYICLSLSRSLPLCLCLSVCLSLSFSLSLLIHV